MSKTFTGTITEYAIATLTTNNVFPKVFATQEEAEKFRMQRSDPSHWKLVSREVTYGEWEGERMRRMRAEHNCHLCKKEWLGRCFGSKNYGKDVSVDDTPVCDEYVFGGSQEKLEAIQKAEALGVTEL